MADTNEDITLYKKIKQEIPTDLSKVDLDPDTPEEIDDAITLYKKIQDNLRPDLKKRREAYRKAFDHYNELQEIFEEMQEEIQRLEKRKQALMLKKHVGDGTLYSLRTFYKAIRNGETFDDKAVVWSFKNGKSGAEVHIDIGNKEVTEWARNNNALSGNKWRPQITDPKQLIKIYEAFPGLSLNDLDLRLHGLTSHVSGRHFHSLSGKTIEDIRVYVAPLVTLNDYDDISDAKHLYFYRRSQGPNNLERCSGSVSDDGYLGMGHVGIPEGHYDNHILYPLRPNERT